MALSKLQFRMRYGEAEARNLEQSGWELVPCDGTCGEGDRCPGWKWQKKAQNPEGETFMITDESKDETGINSVEPGYWRKV